MKTFGKVAYVEKAKRWYIETEPHVAMRLKRLFSSIHQNAHLLGLADTLDNCRDLAWFLERYPMEVTPPGRLEARAAEHHDRSTLIDALLAGRVAPPPMDLAIPARDYQRVAAAIVLQQGSLLLADDLGVGKTASAICVIVDPRARPALVVTLAHLPRQWESELKRFAPKLVVHILRSSTPYDLTRGKRGEFCAKRHRWVPDASAGGGQRCSMCSLSRDDAYHGRANAVVPDVIITSYAKLAGWSDHLAPIVKSTFFDEVQELRHREHGGKPSKKWNGAFHLASAASYRMGLSGTPFYNQGSELHSVLGVLSPEALGTWSEFRTEWCEYGDKPAIKDPKAFGTYLRESGLMLRRTRADVGRELPPLTRVPHHVDADAAALKAVNESCAALARVILKEGQAHRAEKMQASEELSNKLRQATGLAKAPHVADFVRMIVESGESVVLYGWHRAVYDIWTDRLKDLTPALYTGTESTNQKDQSRRRFLAGETKVLIMSLRSGAGLDGLQGSCRTVVFGELDWSPGVHEQGIGRVHRDGQVDPVVAYFLIADSGSDPIVSDVLGVKRQQIEGVKDPDTEFVERLEIDECRVKRLAESFLSQRGEILPTVGMEVRA